jgi:predicted RNA-binding Zn ribbon-like protein
VSKTPSAQIPHELALVIDFVNTLDVETGEDELGTPAELAAWLQRRGLRKRGGALGAQELATAIDLREALRALMLANNGEQGTARAWGVLERAARRGELGVHFDRGEGASLRPEAPGLPGTLAALLVPVAEALADGSWQRAKACRDPDCQYAFYDRSRNRSGVWCEMAVCGNRTKVRTYRSRPRPDAA